MSYSRKSICVVVYFSALFLCCVGSYAQDRIIGQDTLGLLHPRFKNASYALVEYARKPSAVGILDTTFGSDVSSLRTVLNSGRFNYVRVHLINGSCIANRNCGKYESGYAFTLSSFNQALLDKNKKLLSYLVNRTKVYCELQRTLPEVRFLISPVLEHRLSTKAYRIVADTVKNECPLITLVNNPVSGKGERYKGAWIESHDPSRAADIYSFDGKDTREADLKMWSKKTAKAKILFVWSRLYNGRKVTGFEDPRKRTAFPNKQDIKLLSRIFDSYIGILQLVLPCKFLLLSKFSGCYT